MSSAYKMQTWSGTFNSNIYPQGYASGMAQVKINLDQTDYVAPLTIVYTGLYRKGHEMTAEAHIEDNIIKAKFASGQLLTFRIIAQTKDCIHGEYQSESPTDYGNFTLRPNQLLGSQYPSCQII